FLMITMCMSAEQNLGVGELEPQLLDRLFNRRHVPLIRTVDEDIPLRRNNEEGTQRFCSNVVKVADDLVRRELFGLIFRRTHIAFQYRAWRISTSLNRDCR